MEEVFNLIERSNDLLKPQAIVRIKLGLSAFGGLEFVARFKFYFHKKAFFD